MTGIPRQCRSCGGGCGGGYGNKPCRYVGADQAAEAAPLNRAVAERMRFIDFLLCQYGTINRSALIDYFGISAQQAASDLGRYIKLSPGNMGYDTSRKCYYRTANFMRVLP